MSEAESAGQEDVEEHLHAAVEFCMVSQSRSKYQRDDSSITKNFEEAQSISAWTEAINQKYQALVDTETWSLVDKEPFMRQRPLFWTFIVKLLGVDSHSPCNTGKNLNPACKDSCSRTHHRDIERTQCLPIWRPSRAADHGTAKEHHWLWLCSWETMVPLEVHLRSQTVR